MTEMRKLGIALLVLLLLAAPVLAEYRVEFKSRPTYIVTQYCDEYVYYDEAVLMYEDYAYDKQDHLQQRREL
jgi:hypothetical protein